VSNLGSNLVGAVRTYPGGVGLRCGDREMTYAEFGLAAARVATLLQHAGVRPGDRVGLMLPNTPAFAVAFYGIMYRGAVAVPMNILLKPREVEFYLSNTSASALFAPPGFAAEARAGASAAGAQCWIVDDDSLADMIATLPEQHTPLERADSDTAVILHTSGTTGKPKGVELTHGGLGRNAEVMWNLLNLGPDDVVLGCLPLFHAFGLTAVLNATVMGGATLTLMPRFDPRMAWQVIARDGVTIFEGVPTTYSALLGVAAGAFPQAPRTLRMCVSGGASLPVQVLTDFEQAFGCAVLEGYGLSEATSVASFNHPDRPRKPGSIGTPVEGVQMRVVDEQGRQVAQGESGEIQIRGHNVMKGYWNLAGATAAVISPDGWLSTGDIGRTDEDGYYYIVDRKKDLIIRGGYNVYPREIEEVLYEHPAVADAAVIGIPHPLLGEEVGAAVVLKTGAAAPVEEIRDFVKTQVAAYKYPRLVWFVDNLPKGPTGKVQRRDITIPTTNNT
jgi:long-chain acyl-CoA synthetase